MIPVYFNFIIYGMNSSVVGFCKTYSCIIELSFNLQARYIILICSSEILKSFLVFQINEHNLKQELKVT